MGNLRHLKIAATVSKHLTSEMRKFVTAALVITLMQITSVLSAEDNDDQIIDSSAVFDMDYCCDEYKKCIYKIGRNRP
ncbi:hypothetical protein HNY73_002166 [Argiope bruennichi]|uniref:Uncharacterized protein n=1 Tax=Argiope bruennichi TaxID=94029 RepID=A0A8T0FWY4_ARGBR|nr:hypothetical protein HNY73_002166 [Argiope bruennichi]